MATDLIIETKELNFSYKKGRPILKDIDLRVPKGSIYGFLGPNGSGKTTTLRILLGLIRERNLRITIFGQEFRSNRISILGRIGSLIEQPSLYAHLTAKENLEIIRLSYGCSRDRIFEVLKMTGLWPEADKKVRQFSLGMKQRLAIALALLNDPELIILDEPTNGLDPSGIFDIRELLKKLNQDRGITILLSSHLLSEVEKIISHLGILSQGKLLFQGTLAELHQVRTNSVVLYARVNDVSKTVKILDDHYHCSVQEDCVRTLVGNKEDAATIARRLVENDIDLYELYMSKNDLETIFLEIVSR